MSKSEYNAASFTADENYWIKFKDSNLRVKFIKSESKGSVFNRTYDLKLKALTTPLSGSNVNYPFWVKTFPISLTPDSSGNSNLSWEITSTPYKLGRTVLSTACVYGDTIKFNVNTTTNSYGKYRVGSIKINNNEISMNAASRNKLKIDFEVLANQSMTLSHKYAYYRTVWSSSNSPKRVNMPGMWCRPVAKNSKFEDSFELIDDSQFSDLSLSGSLYNNNLERYPIRISGYIKIIIGLVEYDSESDSVNENTGTAGLSDGQINIKSFNPEESSSSSSFCELVYNESFGLNQQDDINYEYSEYFTIPFGRI